MGARGVNEIAGRKKIPKGCRRENGNGQGKRKYPWVAGHLTVRDKSEKRSDYWGGGIANKKAVLSLCNNYVK